MNATYCWEHEYEIRAVTKSVKKISIRAHQMGWLCLH
jgi:hypothetical protein